MNNNLRSDFEFTIRTVALIGVLTLLTAAPASAQLITMSKECRAQIASAAEMNAAGQFQTAEQTLLAIVADCDTKDAREAVQVGLAKAYNGQGRFEDAIAAANQALEDTKQTSIDALFEKALAEEGLGNAAAARADYDNIIALTEKNQNTRERATLYAKIADMDYRAGRKADAEQNIAKAMELDPDNPDFYVQRGDWAVVDGNAANAFRDYDQAVAMGRNDAQMYAIRAEARIGMAQKKYGTENVQALRGQLTDGEKQEICSEVGKSLEMGLVDMQMDMFSALVCR